MGHAASTRQQPQACACKHAQALLANDKSRWRRKEGLRAQAGMRVVVATAAFMRKHATPGMQADRRESDNGGRWGAGLRGQMRRNGRCADAGVDDSGMRESCLSREGKRHRWHDREMCEQSAIAACFPMKRQRMRVTCATARRRIGLRRTMVDQRRVQTILRIQRLRHRRRERRHQDCEQSEDTADLLQMAAQHRERCWRNESREIMPRSFAEITRRSTRNDGYSGLHEMTRKSRDFHARRLLS